VAAVLATTRRLFLEDGITVYPMERTGNQLFMWATGLAQARRFGVPCYVSLGLLKHEYAKQFNYQFLLTSFDNGMIIPDDERAHIPLARAIRKPLPPAADVVRTAIAERLQPVFIERPGVYDKRVEKVTPGLTMFGYFQSWRYFEAIDDEVRERVRGLRSPSAWFEAMAKEIQPGSGAIILNIRRGDYLNSHHVSLFGFASGDYYRRALLHLRSMGMTGPVYLMSDSLDLAMAELEGVGEIRPIEPPAGVDAVEQILLLANADALVIGNSTFAWWGGYMGERPDRPVIAPRPWLNRLQAEHELLLPNWITFDRGSQEVPVAAPVA
jgi:hypothetical protein